MRSSTQSYFVRKGDRRNGGSKQREVVLHHFWKRFLSFYTKKRKEKTLFVVSCRAWSIFPSTHHLRYTEGNNHFRVIFPENIEHKKIQLRNSPKFHQQLSSDVTARRFSCQCLASKALELGVGREAGGGGWGGGRRQGYGLGLVVGGREGEGGGWGGERYGSNGPDAITRSISDFCSFGVK